MTSTSSTHWKHWRKTVAGLVGILIVISAFGFSGYVREILLPRIDRAVGDWLISVTGGPPERQDLVLLGIDDASLKLDGLDPAEVEANPTLKLMKQRFPWDRRVWAAAIDKLSDAGAKLIVLDLIFSEASDPAADAELVAAIKRHPDKVLLASSFSPVNTGEGDVFMLMEPDFQFIEAGPRIGYVNFYKDSIDGLERKARYTSTINYENKGVRLKGEPEFRSMAGEVIHAMGGEVPSGDHDLRFSRKQHEGGASETYAPRSVYGIFADKEWKSNYDNGAFFRDKVVMIGPVAPRFQDIHATPVGPISGPQLHLQAIACGLSKAFIRRSDNVWYGIIILSLISLVWIRVVNRPLLSVFGLVLIIGAVGVVILWFGAAYSYLLAVSGGLIAMVFGWAVALSFEMVIEKLEKGRLRKDFRRFVSRDVADAMIEQPERWRESAMGVKRPIVVLFSDVRGFTERSEQSDPSELVKQLNEYLTSMVEVIFRHDGTLDKFIGDAVMAHWGALGGGNAEDHTRKAILAARDMIEVLRKLNEEWVAAGKAPFQIGVGLHYGEAVAGEIGSPERTEFAVIGDTVNLASRLEGLTKAFHCEVLFSDEVRSASGVKDGIIDLGLVRVKGRRNPVRLYGIGDEEAVLSHLQSFERDADGVIVMTTK